MFAILAALTMGAALATGVIPISSPPALAPTEPETLVVPTEQNEYFEPDIRFKLTLPSAYLHQRGETWKSPINGVNFAINLKDNGATSTAPQRL
jgi:hypothetical protein